MIQLYRNEVLLSRRCPLDIFYQIDSVILPQRFTAGFTGPRAFKLFKGVEECPECRRLKRTIRECILLLYEKGAEEFISGMATGIDTFAAEAVLSLKAEGVPIKLTAAVASPYQTENWKEKDAARFADILKRADHQITVSRARGPSAYKARNEYIVKHSDVILAFPAAAHRGGTLQTMNMALRHNIPLLICPVES